MTVPSDVSRSKSRTETIDLAAARSYLEGEFVRLSEELATARTGIAADVQLSTGGGDTADTAARWSGLDQEVALSDRTQRLLEQTAVALKRLDQGRYELCWSCGHPIGTERLRAFPRATMCIHCRQLAIYHG